MKFPKPEISRHGRQVSKLGLPKTNKSGCPFGFPLQPKGTRVPNQEQHSPNQPIIWYTHISVPAMGSNNEAHISPVTYLLPHVTCSSYYSISSISTSRGIPPFPPSTRSRIGMETGHCKAEQRLRARWQRPKVLALGGLDVSAVPRSWGGPKNEEDILPEQNVDHRLPFSKRPLRDSAQPTHSISPCLIWLIPTPQLMVSSELDKATQRGRFRT